MKKIITICLLVFTVPCFSELNLKPNDPVRAFIKNMNDKKNVSECVAIGGALLNMMRISEGETDTGIPLEVSVEHLDIITGILYRRGFRSPLGDDDIPFYYYYKNCRRPTEKDYVNIGSPSFKGLIEEIFSIYE